MMKKAIGETHIKYDNVYTACGKMNDHARTSPRSRYVTCGICVAVLNEEKRSLGSNQRKTMFLLRRDSFICGLHVGGCGNFIRRKGVVIGEHVNQDHIVPKDFFNSHDAKDEFQKIWNIQPMHKRCNGRRRGTLDTQFRCACHHTYVNEDNSVDLFYKDNNEWSKVQLLNPYPSGRVSLVNNLFPTVRYKLGVETDRKGNVVSYGYWETDDGREYGHAFSMPRVYEIYNAIQLFATFRWKMCIDECSIFRAKFSDTSEISDAEMAKFYTIEFLANIYDSSPPVSSATNDIQFTVANNIDSMVRDIQQNMIDCDVRDDRRYRAVRVEIANMLRIHVRNIERNRRMISAHQRTE